MKTFYTERDIEDLHARGVTEIAVDDDVVLTDLAREKAEQLGVRLKQGGASETVPVDRLLRNLGAQPAAARNLSADEALVQRIKAGVIAKLGTTEYNGLLDQVIPQIVARLGLRSNSNASNPSRPSSSDY